MTRRFRKPLTLAEENQIRELIENTSLSAAKIALAVGRPRGTIIGWAHKRGGLTALRAAKATEQPPQPAPAPVPDPIVLTNLRPIKRVPDWQCKSPGCTTTRAFPYRHCQSCKARMMRPNKRATHNPGMARHVSSLGDI